MQRGRPRSTPDLSALEQELALLKQRQSELRQKLRKMRSGQAELGKLEEKLSKQLSGARWTAEQILALRPDWDEESFYHSVRPVQPKPRGRRPRSATPAAAE